MKPGGDTVCQQQRPFVGMAVGIESGRTVPILSQVSRSLTGCLTAQHPLLPDQPEQ